ncbi:MAG: hypothetical protein QF685_10310 [Verrucomicrobiota bacterium]|nr:hypothetical protein [Verrucomicrobiota bacterium]
MNLRDCCYMGVLLLMGFCLWGVSAEQRGVRQLVFEGNKVFASAEIQLGLSASKDWLHASHPLATDEEFANRVRHMVLMGYVYAGYLDTSVKVKRDADRRWRVSIVEGPVYRLGKLTIKAPAGLDMGDIHQRLTNPDYQPPDMSAPSDADKLLDNQFYGRQWRKGEVGSVSFQRVRLLAHDLRLHFQLDGYPNPRIHATVRRDLKAGRVGLGLEVRPGARILRELADVEINGCEHNKPSEVLNFLGIKTGMKVERLMERRARERLWLSGRFLKHEVAWRKLDGDEEWKLVIDLMENPRVPPLGEALPAEARMMLALSRMVSARGGMRGEWAFAVNAKLAENLLKGHEQFGLRGAFKDEAFVLETEVVEEGKARLMAGVVRIPDNESMLHIPSDKVKWTEPADGFLGMGLLLNFKGGVHPNPTPRGRNFFIKMNGTLSTMPQPVRVDIDFAPAWILGLLYAEDGAEPRFRIVKTEAQRKGGYWVFRGILRHGRKEAGHLVVRADEKTYNPIGLEMKFEFDGGDGLMSFQANFEKKPRALNAMRRRIVTAAVDARELNHPDCSFSSGVNMLFRHVAGPLVDWVGTLSGVNFKLSEKADVIGGMVEPLDDLFKEAGSPFFLSEKSFDDKPAPGQWLISHPVDFQPDATRSLPAGNAVIGLLLNNGFTPGFMETFRGWGRDLAREQMLFSIGRSANLAPVLERLSGKGDPGPFSCLLAAKLLNESGQPGGPAFADKGMRELNVAGMRRDIAAFSPRESPQWRAVVKSQPLFKEVPLERLSTALGLFLPPGDIASLVGQLEKWKTRANADANADGAEDFLLAMAMALGPALRMELEWARLGSLADIRRRAFEGSVAHQFGLAMLHLKGQQVQMDKLESFHWATLAARKGHPDARALREHLLRQMTPKEIVEATRRLRGR